MFGRKNKDKARADILKQKRKEEKKELKHQEKLDFIKGKDARRAKRREGLKDLGGIAKNVLGEVINVVPGGNIIEIADSILKVATVKSKIAEKELNSINASAGKDVFHDALGKVKDIDAVIEKAISIKLEEEEDVEMERQINESEWNSGEVNADVVDDRKNAREHFGNTYGWLKVASTFFVFACTAFCLVVMVFVDDIPKQNVGVFNQITGAFVLASQMIIAFYFSSSQGSKQKSRTMAINKK